MSVISRQWLTFQARSSKSDLGNLCVPAERSSYTHYVILSVFEKIVTLQSRGESEASAKRELRGGEKGSIQEQTITALKYNYKTHLGKTLKHFHRNIIHLLVHIIIITVYKLR